jgi:hypothetical protein
MLKIILLSLGAGIVGYLIGFIGGMFAIQAFSSNTHDRGVEAAMTAAFVIGPLAAILALGATLLLLLGRWNA